MDTQFQIAILELLDMDRIIQVLGICTVDSKDDLISQVQASFKVLLRRTFWYPIGLRQNFVREFRHDIHGFQNFQDIDPYIILMPHHVPNGRNKVVPFLVWIGFNVNFEDFRSGQYQR